MNKDKESKALGRFKIRLIELEDSIDHTLDRETVCNLIDEIKKEIFEAWESDAVIYPSKTYGKLLEWFGNP